jgi:hypothetical protein
VREDDEPVIVKSPIAEGNDVGMAAEVLRQENRLLDEAAGEIEERGLAGVEALRSREFIEKAMPG